ncbi:MAG: GTP-binding protein [Candidatus Thorarchaeota archaeon]
MREQLKTLLLNYMNNIEGVIVVAVCDIDGLVIISEGEEQDDIVIGGISSYVEKYIDQLKDEFSVENNFFNVTTTSDKKFVFCSQGPNSILTAITEISTPDVQLRVLSEHVAGKIELILEGQEDISLEIPDAIQFLSKTKEGTLSTGDFAKKVIITGDYQVGKSSIIRTFTKNEFKDDYISTLGVEISKKDYNLNEKTKITFVIWDIAGQIQFMAPYRAQFYSGANAAFIVIDRTRQGNIKSIKSWYADITKDLPSNIPIVIVGNKSDLKDKIVISEEEIKSVADELGFHYILTSAKTGENINESFIYVAYKILSKSQ